MLECLRPFTEDTEPRTEKTSHCYQSCIRQHSCTLVGKKGFLGSFCSPVQSGPLAWGTGSAVLKWRIHVSGTALVDIILRTIPYFPRILFPLINKIHFPEKKMFLLKTKIKGPGCDCSFNSSFIFGAFHFSFQASSTFQANEESLEGVAQ